MADIASLQALAAGLRARIIETSSRTGTPHLASCLSCVDILTVLYFAGSITCNAARAARSNVAASGDSVTASELRNSMFPLGPMASPGATMPAPLEWRP